MENVFRTFLTTVVVFVTQGAAVQEDSSKETVLINPFACTDAVSRAACDNMRAAVLSGFSDRGRFHIVDALTDETLSRRQGSVGSATSHTSNGATNGWKNTYLALAQKSQGSRIGT